MVEVIAVVCEINLGVNQGNKVSDYGSYVIALSESGNLLFLD